VTLGRVHTLSHTGFDDVLRWEQGLSANEHIINCKVLANFRACGSNSRLRFNRAGSGLTLLQKGPKLKYICTFVSFESSYLIYFIFVGWMKRAI